MIRQFSDVLSSNSFCPMGSVGIRNSGCIVALCISSFSMHAFSSMHVFSNW
jgi:hypothetical protein